MSSEFNGIVPGGVSTFGDVPYGTVGSGSAGTAMLVEEAIVQILRLYTPLTDIIGARIYPMFMPQTMTFPAVYYEQSDEQEEATLEDPGSGGLVRVTVDFISASKGVGNFGDCRRTADALRQGLIAFPGGYVEDIDLPGRSIMIQKIFPADIGTDHDYDSITQIYRFARSFNVWAVKAIP